MKKIKICYFSGKRGGFGALKRALKMIDNDPDLELQIIVSDMHASKEFGETKREIEQDFKIDAVIDMEQKGGTASDRGEAVGRCLSKTTRALEHLKPDALLVLGDRSEVLAATIAAVNLKIPVLHIEGGDISGSLDEFYRHAITKLAHIHFPATKKYAETIKKIGEEDWRIFISGDAHIDPIINNDYNNPEQMVKKYNLTNDYFIILFHSDTMDLESSGYQMQTIFSAVQAFDFDAIIVYPCSDQGYHKIIKIIESQAEERFKIFKNIPAPDFLGLLKKTKAIIGNSSCGIKEAPYLGVPTINIGERQFGRSQDKTIINVKNITVENTKKAIDKALYDEGFRNNLGKCQMIYGNGKTAEILLSTIKGLRFDKNLFNKRINY